MSKNGKTPSERLNECVLGWLDKLAAHFRVTLDEEQIKIFLHALRNNTVYQVDVAFERALNECEFMPKLRDVHMRMPEERSAPENPGAFVLNGPPLLDLVREVAREIYAGYDDLDPIADSRTIFNVCFAANRLRYKRMGIDTSKWDGDATGKYDFKTRKDFETKGIYIDRPKSREFLALQKKYTSS